MRLHRFCIHQPLEVNQDVSLPKEVAHHCIQVLRYREKEQLYLFNGDGFDYKAVITQQQKKQVEVKIIDKILIDNESPLKIHLVQSVARGDKMDFIFQKAVELGVNKITPWFSDRSNVKLDGKRLDKKLQHWKKTIEGACEQSGRAYIPELTSSINSGDNLIDQLATENVIYLEPNASDNLQNFCKNQVKKKREVSLIIGPEGGLSNAEIKQLSASHAVGVNLGPRILRTETAALTTVSILQSLVGDIK